MQNIIGKLYICVVARMGLGQNYELVGLGLALHWHRGLALDLASRGQAQPTSRSADGGTFRDKKPYSPVCPEIVPLLVKTLILLDWRSPLGSANPFKGLRGNIRRLYVASSTFLQLSSLRCPPKARVNPVRAEKEFERGQKFKGLRDTCSSLHTREKSA